MTFLPFKPIIVHLKKVIRLHIGRNASEGSYKLYPHGAGRGGQAGGHVLVRRQ